MPLVAGHEVYVKRIKRPQVVHTGDRTILVTPSNIADNSFTNAVRYCKFDPPIEPLEHTHGEIGDIITLPPLNDADAGILGRVAARANQVDQFYPKTAQELEQQMHLARFVTGQSLET